MNEILRYVRADLEGGVLSLPRFPNAVQHALRVIRDEDSSIVDIARAVSLDPSLASRVLQVANSAWYWADSKVSSVHGAVARLGAETTLFTILGFGVRDAFRAARPEGKAYLALLWGDSLRVASFAAVLARRAPRLSKDTAFLAGLLTHVGRLPLLEFYEHHAGPALQWDRYQRFMEAHGDVLREEMLTYWGFPDELVCALYTQGARADGVATYSDILWVARDGAHKIALEFNQAEQSKILGVTHEELTAMSLEVDAMVREFSSIFS